MLIKLLLNIKELLVYNNSDRRISFLFLFFSSYTYMLIQILSYVYFPHYRNLCLVINHVN